MNNFGEYITPKKAIELGDRRSLEELNDLCEYDDECEVCGNKAWKFAGTGMCFTCTTGETDASDDYELIKE